MTKQHRGRPAPLSMIAVIAAACAGHATAASDAWAAPRPESVTASVVLGYYLDEREASWLSRELTKCAPRTASLASASTLPTMLSENGRTGPGDFDDTNKRDALVAELRAAAAMASIDIVVAARVKRSKTQRSAQVLIVPIREPERLVDVPLAARPDGARDAKAIQSTVMPALASATASVSAAASRATTAEPPAEAGAATPSIPPLEATRPSDGPDRASASEGAETDRTLDHADLVVSVEAGAVMRHFDYVDKLSPQLRTYDLAAAPMAALRAEVYPWARSGRGPLDVGLTGMAGQSIGAQSAVPHGAIGTTWIQFDVGARARVRTGRDSSPALAASAAYGGIDFTFSDAGALANEIPESKYRFLRGGVDVRVPIGRFAITAACDYLGVLSAGAAADRFPRSATQGVTARVGLGATIAQGFEARIAANYTRFIYALAPEPGDRYVAGGALDQLGSLTLGLAYFH